MAKPAKKSKSKPEAPAANQVIVSGTTTFTDIDMPGGESADIAIHKGSVLRHGDIPKPDVAGFAGNVSLESLGAEYLRSWKGNVRRQKDAEAVKELKASIRQYGVLTSLVVRPAESREEGQIYEVLAGQQRLQAVHEVMEEDNLDTYPVPCRIINANDQEAEEVSLAENIIRRQLSPADEFEAFKAMADKGASVADIAHKFGVGESTVKKRLKLANVSPKILQDFREGKLELNQLQSFAIVDDHKSQEKLAKRAYDSDAQWIRDQLMKGKAHIAPDDKRVKFVGGIRACKDAGIALVEDLFDPDAGYVEDAKALQALVDKTAKDMCDHYKAQGYSFVEFHAGGIDTTALTQKFGYSYQDPQAKELPRSKEDDAVYKAWEAELKSLEKQEDNVGLNMAEDHRKDQLEQLMTRMQDTYKGFPQKERKNIGVLIGIDYHGLALRFVNDKAAQKKEAQEQAAREKASGKTSKASKPAKAVSVASKQKNDGTDENITLALMTDITTHRTAAIADVLADTPNVAMATLFEHLHEGLNAKYDFGYGGKADSASLHVELGKPSIEGHLNKKGAVIGFDKLREKKAALKAEVDKAGGAFTWAMKQKPEALHKAFAVLTAGALDDISRTGRISANTLKVWRELKVDMSKYYTPTAKDLFSRVPAAFLKETIKECRTNRGLSKAEQALTPAEEKLKRDGLAALAEKEAASAAKAGNPWLPHPMRLPEDKKASVKPATKAAKKKS